MPIAIDALPYVLSNSALTLLDQQSHEGNRAAAAKTALSRRSGQPGALDAKTADYWSGPLATLYSDLKSNTLIPDRPTLPALPSGTATAHASPRSTSPNSIVRVRPRRFSHGHVHLSLIPPARKLSTLHATREAEDKLGPRSNSVPLRGKAESCPLGVSGGWRQASVKSSSRAVHRCSVEPRRAVG